MIDLVVDARCLGHPGLGRHVRQVLRPEAHPGLRTAVIVPPGTPAASLPDPQLEIVEARSPIYAAREQVELPLLIRRLRPRLVHFPHFNAPLVVPAPFLVTIHDLAYFGPAAPTGSRSPRRLAATLVYRSAARRARAIVTVSETMKAEIVARLAVDPARITVIPNAVDPIFGPAAPGSIAEAAAPMILYVGSWQPRKNVPILVAAFRALRATRPLRLVLAGKTTPAEREAVAAACHLDHPDIVQAGDLPDPDLAALYRAATVFVFPSDYEGFGIPVAEAMASGTPVVAGACAAVVEVAAGAARLVPLPLTPEALAAAIAALLDDPELRRHLADLGIGRAREFTIARTAESMRRAYDRAVTTAGSD